MLKEYLGDVEIHKSDWLLDPSPLSYRFSTHNISLFLQKKKMTKELAKNTLSQTNTPPFESEIDNKDDLDRREDSNPEDTDLDLSSNTPASGAKKHRRPDHNEIERKRRETQRDRIDELRQVLPGVSSSSRLSTVNVVIRAKEYIESLRKRVNELEGILAHYHPEIFKHTGKIFLNTSISPIDSGDSLPISAPGSPYRNKLAPKAPTYPTLPSFSSTPPLQSPQQPRHTPVQSTESEGGYEDGDKPTKIVKIEGPTNISPIEEEALKKRIVGFFRSQKTPSSTTLPSISSRKSSLTLPIWTRK